MTIPEDNQQLTNRESRLMESLLERAVKPSADEDAARVDMLMLALQAESDGQTIVTRASKRDSQKLIRWLPIPIAAGILVAILLLAPPGGSANAAMTALDRTIAAEQKPNAREYAVSITRVGPGSTRTLQHRLFVRRQDFAISRKRPVGTGELWIGGRGDRMWIVPAGRSPVLVGGRDLLAEIPSQQVLETPFMSVARILERTKRFYDLTMESEVELRQGEQTVLCQYIVGTRIQSSRVAIPKQVEIWANPETGFAQKVRLVWGKNDESLLLEATANLVGTPTLSADFFDHAAHHEPGRGVIVRN